MDEDIILIESEKNVDPNKNNDLPSFVFIAAKPQSAKKTSTPNKPTNQTSTKKENTNEFQSFQGSIPLFSSLSLITPPHELEESTQPKRIKFNDPSNTYLIDTQANILDYKHKNKSLNSTGDDIHFSNTSSNSSSSPPKDDNNYYGLPLKVKDLLKKHSNISCLYDWQSNILNIMHEKLATMNKIFKDFSSNQLSNIDDF